MIHKYLSILAILSIFSASVNAGEIEKVVHTSNQPSMSITASPLKLLLMNASVGYAVRLADFVALTIPVEFQYNPPALYSALGMKGFSQWMTEAGIGARFFLGHKAFTDGWFIEPEVKIGYQSVSYQNTSIHATRVIPAFRFGYSWFFDSGFNVNLGGGFGYGIIVAQSDELAKARKGNQEIDRLVTFGNLRPSLDFSLGYAW